MPLTPLGQARAVQRGVAVRGVQGAAAHHRGGEGGPLAGAGDRGGAGLLPRPRRLLPPQLLHDRALPHLHGAALDLRIAAQRALQTRVARNEVQPTKYRGILTTF